MLCWNPVVVFLIDCEGSMVKESNVSVIPNRYSRVRIATKAGYSKYANVRFCCWSPSHPYRSRRNVSLFVSTHKKTENTGHLEK